MHVKILLHVLQRSCKYGHALYLAKDKSADAPLVNKISKDHWAIKCKTIKRVLTVVCVILHLSVPRRLVCIYCVAGQLLLIRGAWLDFDTASLRHQPALSLSPLCLLLTCKAFYFNFCIIRSFRHAEKFKSVSGY